MAGIGNLGIALGSAAGAFEQGQQLQLKQKQQESLENYRTQELQLQQQSIQNAQQRAVFEQTDKARKAIWDHITEYANQSKMVGKFDPAEFTKHVQGFLDADRRLAKSGGLPETTDAMLAGIIAMPNPADVQKKMSEAKVDPLKAATPTVMGEAPISGEPVYGTYNRESGKFEPTQIPQPKGQVGDTFNERFGSEQPSAQKAEAFLSRLPDRLQSEVKGIANYEINPSTFSTRIPKGSTQSPRERMIGLAQQYAEARGETYDSKEFAGRNATVRTFSSGTPESRAVRSHNVLIPHLDTLGKAIDALSKNNGDIKAFNRLSTKYLDETGKTAPNNFEGVMDIVGDEIVKAIQGTAGALGDREQLKKRMSVANSPAQLREMVDYYRELSAGQLGGLKRQYEGGSGRKDFNRFLDDRTIQVFEERNRAKAERGNLTGATPKATGEWSAERIN